MPTAFDELLSGMRAGSAWSMMGESDNVKSLLERVFEERIHKGDRDRFQIRANLQRKEDVASFAGFITAEGNPASGPYQGTSCVWFPGDGGSVAVLVIGTDGFGADTGILGRPGHARRLRALSRLHRGRLWVKPDHLDLSTGVPDSVVAQWPVIDRAIRQYSRYVYAATVVRDAGDADAVSDLLDLFFHEHSARHKGPAKSHWEERAVRIDEYIFPKSDETAIKELLLQRRFVILEGPPGTGKTMLARRVGEAIGSWEMVQFHPARTYEDFVVGLFPQVLAAGLAFEVRPGDLLRANSTAAFKPHVLVIDEMNRADLGRVLGEAVSLFEVGEADRAVRLPHAPPGHPAELQLSPHLFVLGTRNTADRSIARIDLAIRRRFAFIQVWPDLAVVQAQSDDLATATFAEVLRTFTEFADDDGLRLVPGHAYFLDPRPDLDPSARPSRIAQRLLLEVVPLLRDYVEERLLGPASSEVSGLADRIEAQVASGGL